ncbi:hypothetical protein HBI56_116340 [Parastagonospora nodorum]|uniref:Uncharacterized protein n=1 Tax=Phaeosphaeria nodorum (strain SN15 / ATCC MYA-4574 / FGSC 10173) TaxID=321614 RepID=A0A7U2F8V9_PHANO|nr:hypothetical protein HBH56_238250 [Parastagonospora nodorum]QRD00687.1 hypothetical protein JI435_415630 [Parastagonospora nodorum SN15]KAH3925720.1 hypothetical protein HBH54_177040 [Parastagonospora nodorum]KAH3953285.1 hypothetical protein HBH53_038410 [Parastagonospora nodorum]KAH3976420.1 hypothetical protein HBH52_120230 [Parastagonospora nodorum]
MPECEGAVSSEQWPGEERSGGAGVVVQIRRRLSGECDCRDARAQGTDADTARTATKSTKSRDDAKDAQEKERETKSAARLAYGRQEGVSASPVGTKGQKRAGSNHWAGSATLQSL